MSDPDAINESCPRCGGAFHCGVADAGGCACFGLQLGPALIEQLRADYTRCLCLCCLAELQSQQPARPPLPPESVTR